MEHPVRGGRLDARSVPVAQDDNSFNAGVVSREWNDAQRAAVIEERNRLLAHPIFKSSGRCVDLLRYLIHCALVDGEAGIKERTLGIEVFGRNADYDVSTDPIVRRVASEIRKRLALYYQECGTSPSVKIDLVRGSYLPEFEFASENIHREPSDGVDLEQPVEPLTLPEQISDPAIHSSSPARISRRNWILGSAALVLVCAAGAWLLHVYAFHSPVYRLWKPLLDSGNVITVCLPIYDSSEIGGDKVGQNGSTGSQSTGQDSVTQDVAVSTLFRDVSAGNTVTATLSNFKKQTDLRPATALQFRDLQQVPAVLIGGLNNPWVPLLLSDLRYSVRFDPATRDAWVQDSQNPAKRDWKIDGRSPPGDPPADYAVVTRVLNQKTGQWIMGLSGLQAKGTETAAKLVSDPKYGYLLPEGIREEGNLQIVLKTSVIRGEPGPIQILAVQSW